MITGTRSRCPPHWTQSGQNLTYKYGCNSKVNFRECQCIPQFQFSLFLSTSCSQIEGNRQKTRTHKRCNAYKPQNMPYITNYSSKQWLIQFQDMSLFNNTYNWCVITQHCIFNSFYYWKFQQLSSLLKKQERDGIILPRNPIS